MWRPARITIDGPAGAGKSTIGEQLARHLGYVYIDTGAMYRALAWLALQKGISVHDATALEQLAREADIQITRPLIDDGRQYTVLANGRDVTWDIRDAGVTRAVSTASSHPGVRAEIRKRQREMARAGNVVMVGRDIGAVVLPDAELKIFLTASAAERARRRYAELVERLGAGNPALPSLEEVQHDIERRDFIDRENMRPAEDAVLIATDTLSVQEVLAKIYRLLEA
ncbi:MAG TPA: (d)CMP kinase [Ktedonobacteraceae bacterium]|nr:(d)CMP kinase [Ktedonobacteraceae bacterium]